VCAGLFAGSTMEAPSSVEDLGLSLPGFGSALPSGGPTGCPSKGSPPAMDVFQGSSFWVVVKRNLKPSSSLVHEAPTPTISLKKDAISKLAHLSSTTLICRFNGLWPQLVDIHDWISRSWAPDLKGDVFIHPCARGFFIAEFDLKEDRDLIFSYGPWFWGSSGLCLKPWTPSFDPSKDSLSSAPVWVQLPNFPLHLWGLSSLRSIGNALGRFHYRCPETEKYNICTYVRICVEMDFSKGFLAKINMTGDNYSWTQKMDYEKIALQCQACFSMGHLAAQCPRGPAKARKQRKSTWWVGSHIDHQLISKDVSSSDDTLVDGIKEAQAISAPSIGDSPNPIPIWMAQNLK
jgi:hypothetical protein